MSTLTHTPGPWEWDWENTDNLYGRGAVQKAREKRAKGGFNWPDGEAIVQTDSRVYGPNDADAALIAAAPDLLAALKAIAEYYDEDNILSGDLEQARTAI